MTDPALPSAAFLPQARRALLKKLAGGAAMGAVMKFGGVGLAFLVLLVLFPMVLMLLLVLLLLGLLIVLLLVLL